MLRIFKFIIFFTNIIFFVSCGSKYIVKNIAPNTLPNTMVDMKNPEFWISRLENSDEIIMEKLDIDIFNSKNLYRSNFFNDYSYTDDINNFNYKSIILGFLKKYQNKKLFLENGKKFTSEDFYKIYKNLDFTKNYNKQFGFVVNNTFLKKLPFKEKVFTKKNNIFFDDFIVTSININTPIVIYYYTNDNSWAYVASEDASGFIETKDIAISSYDKILSFLENEKFLIALYPRAEIFDETQKYFTFTKMGSRFIFLNEIDDKYKILFPFRGDDGFLVEKEFFVKKEKFNSRYLPYTKRNLINTFFKFIDFPYGWGGMDGNEDCSGMIFDAFKVFGINLPRNSFYIAKSIENSLSLEKTLSEFDKKEKIKNFAIDGCSVLYFPGHIMFYLGEFNDNLYVIHSIWRYIDGKNSKIINRVVVSDLSLGKEGISLLKRISIISNLNLANREEL